MTHRRSNSVSLLSLLLACALVASMSLTAVTPGTALAEDEPEVTHPDTEQPADGAPSGIADPEGGDTGTGNSAGAAAADATADVVPVRPSKTSFPGAGTEASPYRISDADMLVEFAELYNTASFGGDPDLYVELTDDIDLTNVVWEPIGSTKTMPFIGHFNGGGHTISNLKIADTVGNGSSEKQYAYGLFGFVAQGEISQIQVTIDIAVASKTYGIPSAGALAGVITPATGAEVLLEDCSGSGTITVTGGEYAVAGGLIGCASLDGADQNIRIFGGGSMTAVSAVNASKENRAGGLIGYVTADAENSNLAVSGCEAFEAVSVKQSSPSPSVINAVGGLIGSLYVHGQGTGVALIECKANGEVSSEGDVNYNDAGGLVGSVQVSGGHLKYDNCSATGAVKANGSATDAKQAAEEANGGLDLFGGSDDAATENGSATKSKNLHDTSNDAGGALGYMLVDGGTAEALGLSASGSVSSTGTMAQNDGGGLIGYLDLQQEGSALSLKACAATGGVEVRDAIANNAGGLIGWTDAKESAALEIANSSAKGAVKAENGTENNAGGLMGNAEISTAASCALSACSSQSETTSLGQGTYSEAGGLVASVYCFDKAQATISSCFTTGKVEAKDAGENYAGGLVASFYAESGSTAAIADCYTLGEVLASGSGDSNDAGALVGYACGDRGSVSISTSYTAGKVTVNGGSKLFNNAGGIVGSVDAFSRSAGSSNSATATGTPDTGESPETTLAVIGCVALSESVTAVDSAQNSADRVLGSLGPKSTGTLTLERNFTWENMLVDNAADKADEADDASDAEAAPASETATDYSGQGESATTLLDPSFWTNAEAGPGFNGEGVWTIQDGKLPLLASAQAAAYTPEYLAPPDEGAPAKTSEPDFEEYVTFASRILLAALGCLAVFLITRALYRRHKRKKEQSAMPEQD